MKYLDNINLYGKEIKILAYKNDIIYSRFSRILTLLTIIAIITFTWIIGKDVIYKNNPLSYRNQILSPYYPKINLSTEIFPFAIGLFGQSNFPKFNSTMIDIKLIKKFMKFNEETGETLEQKNQELKLITCSYENFPTLSKKEFNQNILSAYLCPENFDLYVEGYWNNNNLTTIDIVASKCDFDKNPDFCMKEEDINKYISTNTLNLNLLTLNTILSLSDYNNPITFYGNLFIKFLELKKNKFYNLYMLKQKIISDSGIFTNSLSEIEFLKLVEEQNDEQEINPVDKILMVMTINASNFRKYLKIYDVLASIGGLLKIVTMIFRILNSPFADIDKIKMFLENSNSYQNRNSDKNKYIIDRNNNNSMNFRNNIYNNINNFDNFKLKLKKK